MELEAITTDVKSLLGMSDDADVNDDEFVYATFDVMRRAHATASRFLIEGRYPEMQRCLDLCYLALAKLPEMASSASEHSEAVPVVPERLRSLRGSLCDSLALTEEATSSFHSISATVVAATPSPGAGGRILSSTEDQSLFAALLARTQQLQQQLNTALQTRPTRGSDCFLQKLASRMALDRDSAADVAAAHEAAGGAAAEMAQRGWAFTRVGLRAPTAVISSPPDRGISRRQQRNDSGGVLPPLVTPIVLPPSHPAPSDRNGCTQAEQLVQKPVTYQESSDHEEGAVTPKAGPPSLAHHNSLTHLNSGTEFAVWDSTLTLTAEQLCNSHRSFGSRAIRFYEKPLAESTSLGTCLPTVRRLRHSLTADWLPVSENTLSGTPVAVGCARDLQLRIAKVKELERQRAREEYMQHLRGNSRAPLLPTTWATDNSSRRPQRGRTDRTPAGEHLLDSLLEPQIALGCTTSEIGVDLAPSSIAPLDPKEVLGTVDCASAPSHSTTTTAMDPNLRRTAAVVGSATALVDAVQHSMAMRIRHCQAVLNVSSATVGRRESVSDRALIPFAAERTTVQASLSMISDSLLTAEASGGSRSSLEGGRPPSRPPPSPTLGEFLRRDTVLAYQPPPHRLLPPQDAAMQEVQTAYEANGARVYAEVRALRHRAVAHEAMVQPPVPLTALIDSTSDWRQRGARRPRPGRGNAASTVGSGDRILTPMSGDPLLGHAATNTYQIDSIPVAPGAGILRRSATTRQTGTTMGYPPRHLAAPVFHVVSTSGTTCSSEDTPLSVVPIKVHCCQSTASSNTPSSSCTTVIATPLLVNRHDFSMHSAEGEDAKPMTSILQSPGDVASVIAGGLKSVQSEPLPPLQEGSGGLPQETPTGGYGLHGAARIAYLKDMPRDSYDRMVRDVVVQHYEAIENEKHDAVAAAWPIPGAVAHQARIQNGLALFPPSYVTCNRAQGQRTVQLPHRSNLADGAVQHILQRVTAKGVSSLQRVARDAREDLQMCRDNAEKAHHDHLRSDRWQPTLALRPSPHKREGALSGDPHEDGDRPASPHPVEEGPVVIDAGCSTEAPLCFLRSYLAVSIAAVRIQRVWRGYYARVYYQTRQKLLVELRLCEEARIAATLSIQRYGRGFLGRLEAAAWRHSRPNARRRMQSVSSRRRNTLLLDRRGGSIPAGSIGFTPVRPRRNQTPSQQSILSSVTSGLTETLGVEETKLPCYQLPESFTPEDAAKLRSVQENIAARTIVRYYWTSRERDFNECLLEARAFAMVLTKRMPPEEVLGAVDDNGVILRRVTGNVMQKYYAREEEERDRGVLLTHWRRVSMRELLAAQQGRELAEIAHREAQTQRGRVSAAVSAAMEGHRRDAVLMLQRVGRGCVRRQWLRSRAARDSLGRQTVLASGQSSAEPERETVAGTARSGVETSWRRPTSPGILKEEIMHRIAQRHPHWFKLSAAQGAKCMPPCALADGRLGIESDAACSPVKQGGGGHAGVPV